MTFSRWTIWWLVAALWWTLEGFTSAVSYRRMGALADNPIPLDHALRTGLLSAWLWVPATVLAVWAAERFPLETHLPAGSFLFVPGDFYRIDTGELDLR